MSKCLNGQIYLFKSCIFNIKSMPRTYWILIPNIHIITLQAISFDDHSQPLTLISDRDKIPIHAAWFENIFLKMWTFLVNKQQIPSLLMKFFKIWIPSLWKKKVFFCALFSSYIQYRDQILLDVASVNKNGHLNFWILVSTHIF